MRYLVGFVFVLALGTSLVAGCGEESSIPCDPDLRAQDCPDDGDECTGVTCPVDIAVCRYHVVAHTIGAGCSLSDGSVGYCDIQEGCTEESGPISCKRSGSHNDYPNGVLCRSPDEREGTCLHGVCGGENFCEGVVCDEPDNLCGSDQFCNWGGLCEFRQVTHCPSDGSSCTFDECDPDKGCVYILRPDGADCAPEVFCCLLIGARECCDGSCTDGICVPD
jgi:hypothetical protein